MPSRFLATLGVGFVCIGLAAAPVRADFVEVSASSGVFGGTPTWGAQIVDMDGDGDLDLLNGRHFYGGLVFTNEGAGIFSVWSIPQIVTSAGDRHGYAWADLNGDGWLDAVCSHGGNGGCGCSDDGNELWRGTESHVFQVVAGAGGMADPVGRGRAFSAADVDGDGDLDLFHCKAPLETAPNSLYRNDGAFSFVDVAAAWNVDGDQGPVGALFADVDDDGDPDLLLGGEEFLRPTTYYRNDNSSFVDQTGAAFGALPMISWADWGDWENDGDLDLLLVEGEEGVFDTWQEDGPEWWFFANHRFSDDGVDVFEFDTPGENPTARFRVNGSVVNSMVFLGPSAVNPTSSQITLDDTYVGAPSFTAGVDVGLYCWRESPGGRWKIHVSAPPGSFGNFAGTVVTTGGVTLPTASNLETLTLPPAAPRLFRNDGGVFAEVALGLTPAINPRAALWVDYDNDGDLDIHAVNRGTVESGNEPDRLWRNDGAGVFSAVDSPAAPPGLSVALADGAVWGDLDRDGDLDVFVQDGAAPAFFAVGTPPALYRNDGPAGHWLTVEPLTDGAGNTPVGTKVTAWAQGTPVHGRVHANSWRGFQPPLEVHLGLGTETWVDSLVVEWPTGLVQVLTGFPADRHLRLVPGEDPTSVGALPGRSEIGPLRPQPARGLQSFQLANRSPVRVQVFDLAGRRVRDLGSYPPVPGGAPEHLVQWNGRNDAGHPVAAGVYFIRGLGRDAFATKSVRLR